MTWAELLKDAGIELGILDPVEEVGSDFQWLARNRLNGILDTWNAKREAVYTVTYPTFTTTSGLSPHTIGASGATFTVTQRPMEILAANRLLGSGTTLIRIPITVRDEDWWMAVGSPNLQTNIPTDLYYSPTWANGSIYFWPVPDSAYTVELQVRLILAQIAEADLSATISLPPGYQRALTLTLAEDLSVPYGMPLADRLTDKAVEARAVIFGENLVTPRIATRDSGMMTGSYAGGFNYFTGRGAGR